MWAVLENGGRDLINELVSDTLTVWHCYRKWSMRILLLLKKKNFILFKVIDYKTQHSRMPWKWYSIQYSMSWLLSWSDHACKYLWQVKLTCLNLFFLVLFIFSKDMMTIKWSNLESKIRIGLYGPISNDCSIKNLL